MMQKQREAFREFEIEVETWRYEAPDSTAVLDAAWLDQWVESLELNLPRPSTGTVDQQAAFSYLIEQARLAFGSPSTPAELLSEVVRREGADSELTLWERRTGALSIFTPRGTWHQSEGQAAMGPPSTPATIDLFSARLGLVVPGGAKALQIPSGTKEIESDPLVMQLDEGEMRCQFTLRPWKGEGWIRSFEETLIQEGEPGPLVEKRYFLSFSRKVAAGEAPEGSEAWGWAPQSPDAGLEFRFEPRGGLLSYAIVRIHPPVYSPEDWGAVPTARPPFGWRILDYRFLPEKEYVFGEPYYPGGE